jgi:hypothetical protein
MVAPHARVEDIYRRHGHAFSVLEGVFFESHAIPKAVTRDAIKQRILGALNEELSSIWLSSPIGLAISFAQFLMAIGYLLWCMVSGPKFAKVQTDVLFDFSGFGADDFYEGILKKLSGFSIAAFGPSIDLRSEHSRIPATRYFARKNRPYTRGAARIIFNAHFRRFGLYRSLSKQTGVGIFDLALRLCAEVAGHLSSIEGISAKVLVSAIDNGYSPYRYYLYRTHGIESIFLIQNGGRVKLTEFFNSYIYADYYVGWSQNRLDHFIEMHCSNKVALGSVKLSNFLSESNDKKTAIRYDILFVEQIHQRSDPKASLYDSLLRNLVRYSSENPKVRVAYQTRPDRSAEVASSLERLDSILRGSAVIVLDNASAMSAYEHIFVSSLIVALDSSLRCEALGLGKLVLSCCSRDDAYDFVVQYSDTYFVVTTDCYEGFSEKINFLLENIKEPVISASLARLREAAGVHTSNNVAMSVADLVIAELSGNRSASVPVRG